MQFLPGKTGASRISSDIGKALPGSRVIEIDSSKQLQFESKPNQIVVATVGSAPYLPEGYSGLLVFDASPWVESVHPAAELVAQRDWLAAIELLAPTAPVYIRNCQADWGQRFATGQFIATAGEAIESSRRANLYPWSKYLKLECDSNLVDQAAGELSAAETPVLRIDKHGHRSDLIARYPANETRRLAEALRPWVKLQKPTRQNLNRRPVNIELDYEAWR